MSDLCVLAVDQRQWPMGDPEYGDKLLTDDIGGPYTDRCLPGCMGRLGRNRGYHPGSVLHKGWRFYLPFSPTQVRDKKVLLCMCFCLSQEEVMKMAKNKTHFLQQDIKKQTSS